MANHPNIDFDTMPIPTPGCLNLLRQSGVAQQTLTTILTKLAPVEFLPNRCFEFRLEPDAEPAFIIEATDACGETTDLVAWPIREPDRWATLHGRVWALGENMLTNPVTFFAAGALRAVRTPLGWIKAGGKALCIFKPSMAWWHLRDCPKLVGEDKRHGEELARLLQPPKPVTTILVPRDVVEATE